MIKFLIIRILLLILLAAAIVLVPLALPFVIVILVICEAGRAFSAGSASVSTKEAGALFIFGIILFFGSFKFLNLYSGPHGQYIMLAVMCGVAIYGGVFFKRMVNQEGNVYLNKTVDSLTGFHPYLMIVSGVLRIIAETAKEFFSEHVAHYVSYIDIGINVATTMYAIAIMMYIVRTAFIFKDNR